MNLPNFGTKMMLSKSMKYLCVLATMLASLAAAAQVKLSIHTKDSVAFFLFVQNQKVNNWPCTDITIAELKPGKQSIKVAMGSENGPLIEQPVNWKDRTHVSYEIRPVKGQMRIMPVAEAVYQAPLNTAVDSAMVVTPAIESEPIDKGCEAPTNGEVLSALKESLGRENFESKKVILVQQHLNAGCFTVDQLRSVLAMFELEESKLQVVQAAKGHIYNREQLSKLEEEFLLEKNKQRVRALVAGWKTE